MSLYIIVILILLFIVTILFWKLHTRTKMQKTLQNDIDNTTQNLSHLKNEFDGTFNHIIETIIKTNTYDGYKIILSFLHTTSNEKKYLDDDLKILNQTHNETIKKLDKKQKEIIYISHQMRTSLSGLISFTDFLKKTQMTEEQKDFHLAISQSAQELLSLASNMMDAEIDTKQPIEILNIDNINHKVKEITQEKAFSEILVVDDNPINRKLMKHILNGFDVSVTLAENGQEAVELRKVHDFDIIFMDIEMPIMNGVEATISIRKYEKVYKKKESYIVAVTGQYEKNIYLDSGMNDYIPKPIAVEEIKQRLDTL